MLGDVVSGWALPSQLQLFSLERTHQCCVGVGQLALNPFLWCFPTASGEDLPWGEDSPRAGRKREKLWIWTWLPSLFVSFLGPLDQVEGIKESRLSSEAEPSRGTLYSPPNALLLTSAVGHWGLCLTPHHKGLHLGPRLPESVECLQHLMTTNSSDPSTWRSGARGEGVGCPAKVPLLLEVEDLCPST